METEAAANRWVEAWQTAWPSRDVARVASVYADGTIYSSRPFREPDTARGYVERAFGEEELVRSWFGVPIVNGARAAVEYWAILRSPDGQELTIAGCAILRFDDAGHVVSHRDYWDQTDGAREPPGGWGST